MIDVRVSFFIPMIVVLILAACGGADNESANTKEHINQLGSDENNSERESKEKNDTQEEAEVKNEEEVKKDFATLKNEYGEIREFTEKMGPLISVTVPKDSRFTSYELGFTILFAEDVNTENEDGGVRIVGTNGLLYSTTFNNQVEEILEMMGTSGLQEQDNETTKEINELDLDDYPELNEFDLYYIVESKDDNSRDYCLFKNNGNGTFYSIIFQINDSSFTEDKVLAVHNILSSMELE